MPLTQKIKDILLDVVSISTDWVWETDAEHNYTFVSERIEEYTGLAPSHFQKRSRLDVLNAAENQDQVRDHIDQINRHEPFDEFEYWIVRPTGKRCFSLSGRPRFSEDGSFIGYRGVGHDVTELRLREQELESARRIAEDSNEAKTQFLSAVVHELRTPLNSIAGYTEAMKLGVYGDLPDKVTAPLESVLHSAQELNKLIDHLLDTAKAEAGRFELNEVTFGIEPLCSRVFETAKGLAEQFSTEVQFSFEMEPVEIYADMDLLHQILLNLISNAFKYGMSDTPILLKATLEPREGTTELVIRVIDHGPGLTADEIEIAFQEFGQVNADRSGVLSSTGLGLPLARRFVEMHGGSLMTLESTPGHGTTAVLRLPEHRIVRQHL